MTSEADELFSAYDDPRSNEELFQIALTATDEDDDPGWTAIWALRKRPTREVFEAAKELCESSDSKTRTVGVNILAQLGFFLEKFLLDERLELFFRLLSTEQNIEVLNAICVGLGHIRDERAVQWLVKFKNYPSADVRFGVAFGLRGMDDPLAINALIELSADEDDDTRDWATFALGSQTSTDTPEIREALFRRMMATDDPSNAPGEAMVGLARRKDERAIEPILKALATGHAGTLIFEAAEEFADARLYSALVKLKDDSDYDSYEKDRLEDAIAACKPQDQNEGQS